MERLFSRKIQSSRFEWFVVPQVMESGPIRKNAQYIKQKLGWMYKRSDGAGSDSVVLWLVQALYHRCELSSIPGVSNEAIPVSGSQN